MKREISLSETTLKNRWGRDQKITAGDKVRLAPFKNVRSGDDLSEQEGFESWMTEGLKPDEVYGVKRIIQFPDDGTVILYLDLGGGREEGFYAEYLQAVDKRKIKAIEFPLSDPSEVVTYLKTITDQACSVVECEIRAQDRPAEASHPSNQWIILPATSGKCKMTIEGEPREIQLNPEKVIVIPVPAGKKHALLPLSGFSSYKVLCENCH